MRGRILAALVLLAVVAPLVHADFIVIIANLNARGDNAEGGSGDGTGSPAAPGGLGGGRGPGMGSSGPGGLGGLGGLGGMMGGGMGPGGRGMMGGGMGPGGLGGMTGGTPGGAAGSEDGDDDPFIVVAVVEVGELGARLPKFERGDSDKLTNGIDFFHRWGKTRLKSKTPMYEVVPLKSSGQPVLNTLRRFGKQKEKYGASPTPENNLELARWALQHGLTGEFAKQMDAVADAKPDSAAIKPILAAYTKVKADLDREPTKSKAEEWRKLLEGYKIAEGKHYDVINNHANGTAEELKPILDRMERSLRSYYYWWALQGIALPVPAEKQVAFLTEKPDDFKKLKKHLTASPVLADSFFARREGVAVYAGKRNDESYGTLARTSRPYWDGGYQRGELLKGGLKAGIPKDKWATNAMAAQQNRSVPEVDEAHLFALLLKLLEEEWEATGISHEASRQLVYASNLLPRHVHAPEWVMFGMGSFFEVPLQSPFGGVGAASPYWLPRFKESYRAKHYNKDKAAANPVALDALMRVVTDSGFRSRPLMPTPLAGESPAATLHRAEEAHLRRARAASWSLTYFLAKRRPAELQRYFKELSRMPRDVELDDKVLLGCFARAFDCVKPNKTIDDNGLKKLAEDWWNFVKDEAIDGEDIHKKIREYHRQVTRTTPAGAGNSGRGPGGFGPGAAGSGGAGRP